jgi:uncharacterized membrane protein YebE (DUF533 family)
MVKKLYSLIVAFLFFGFHAFSQEVDNVKVSPKHHQSEETTKSDMKLCFAETDKKLDQTKHKTLKNTGVGVGAGVIIGKVIGKTGVGAVAGGAAGAYRGHKKSKQDKMEFQNAYASCLKEKGYEVEIEEED